MHFMLAVIHEGPDLDEDRMMDNILVRSEYPSEWDDYYFSFNIFDRIEEVSKKSLKEMTLEEVSKLGNEILKDTLDAEPLMGISYFNGTFKFYHDGGISDWYTIEETIKASEIIEKDLWKEYYSVYEQIYDSIYHGDDEDDIDGTFKYLLLEEHKDILDNLYVTKVDCHI